MKRCSGCHRTLPLDAFYRSTRRKDGHQGHCKDCSRRYYQANKAMHIAAAIRNNRRTLAQNRRRVLEYLRLHPCADCGESDPVVLEFDHVRGEKRGPIARLLRTHSWPVVAAEIEKCEIRCANCHRRRTAKAGRFYRDLRAGDASLDDECAAKDLNLQPTD